MKQILFKKNDQIKKLRRKVELLGGEDNSENDGEKSD